MKTGRAFKGGSFLVADIAPGEVFTREDVTAGQMRLMKAAQDFIRDEVKPHTDRLLRQDRPLHRELMLKAGKQGLLGADIDREYGGQGLDKIASTLIVAASTEADGLSLTWNAHTGIGTLPLVIFGNDTQKKKYLPGLAKGALIAAYALTEPEAGSDALSIRTRAMLSPDGKHYLLNGEKIFITNAGLADIFVTYAKVEGDKFTAFIVERGYPGVSIGPEVEKMGIRGSSTAAVFFRNAMVPAENRLYEPGRGYEVAFSILNLGRFRLAAGCVEKGKAALEHSVKYARQRVQFGKPLSQFGLIQQKLAEMAVKTYISESLVYRTAGLLNKAFSGADKSMPGYGKQMYKRISEFTAEYSISKVFASEALSDIVDEAVQIYGGRGYIVGNPAERMYRDSRINRIFEGTNEINRLLMVRWLLRKAAAGEIPLFPLAQHQTELPASGAISQALPEGPLGCHQKLLNGVKKIFLFLCVTAIRKYGNTIEEEEEILGFLSEIMIALFSLESGLLRALKSIAAVGEGKSALKMDMVQLHAHEALRKIEDCAAQLLAAMEAGDRLQGQLAALKQSCPRIPLNTVATRRRIAAALMEAEKYVC